MFTENDVKNIFQLFPPPKTSDFLPSLILSSSRHGFVTLQFVQAHFRSRVTKETQRIPLSALASELDVDQKLVLQLVRNHPKLALLSADGKSIIAIDERDAIQEKLTSLLSGAVVSKADLITQNDVDDTSLDFLLADRDREILSIDGFLCSKAYESKVMEAISSLVRQALKDVQPVDIFPHELPNSPPIWFVLRTLEGVLASEESASKISLQETANSISCTPKQLIESKRDATISHLHSGALAYLDLQSFAADFPDLFPTYQDVLSYLEYIPDVQVTEKFAISKAWLSTLEQDCIRILEQEGCFLDILEVIGSRLPASIRGTVASNTEVSITTTFSQSPSRPRITRVGNYILTQTRRTEAVNQLSTYTEADADAQWQQLKHEPTVPKDPKFTPARIANMTQKDEPFLRILLEEKAVEKSLDDHFCSCIAALEAQNEADLATYWTDRVLARYYTYAAGLACITDTKLHDQLAQLLTSYTQHDLVPDAMAKASAQGLALSRKTRKNMAKLTHILSTENEIEIENEKNTLTTTTLTTALNKFAQKQNMQCPPPASVLADTKRTMRDDMCRRLQKQKLPDGGPVCFLTLVVVLCADHFDGVVYATGKFAPRLMRLVKGRVGEAQYERLEGWKEMAKRGELGVEDREGMLGMAGVV
ncbi:hypothetical protein BDW02DRAFT_541568 [Decorospora gaudefroyi]|uniref:Uncharacterized protein n=1 Tax=Decorospora gaudefroyi TaxID=184978 RepID=A0A6A5KTC3_9PLEO|nr:hypothetical protein BDW02DRAFT_541568 [Decorospora gaudefroyi]